MQTRCHKLQVGIICFAIVAFGCEAHAQNLTTRSTGCLGSDGNFSLFALGDAPLAGCPAGQNQVALKLDDLGTIGTGKSADFIVLDANPLENISNAHRISSVYIRGAAVDRTALRRRLVGQAE